MRLRRTHPAFTLLSLAHYYLQSSALSAPTNKNILRSLLSQSPSMSSAIAEMETHKLFDFDANLLHEDLKDRLDVIIQNANEHGVYYFGVPGTTLETSKESLHLSTSERYPSSTFVATCGVHPYNAESEPLISSTDQDELRKLVSLPHCLAVGECGLDYSESFPAKDFQIPCFENQIILAREFKKPLYLHVRAAHSDFISLLCKHGYDGKNNAAALAVHCFTGSVAELEDYVALGCYIGLTGYVINKLNEDQLKEFLSHIPLNKLLIETDAPYMGFEGCLANFETDKKKKKKQKYPNVPSALPFVLNAVSSALGLEESEVATITTRNAKEYFGIYS